jgi:hypothetical protein
VIVREPGDEKRRFLQDEVLDLLVRRVVLARATLREALSVENERLGEALQSVGGRRSAPSSHARWKRVH